VKSKSNSGGLPLAALAILPNRELAQPLLREVEAGGAFQIAAETAEYPSTEDLHALLRRVKPDVILLDVSADLERAAGLIEETASRSPGVPVIGLDLKNGPDALLRCLRAGASEFLHAPFSCIAQQEAARRILRQSVQGEAGPGRARLIVFASAKPGSGASILAAHTAMALRQATGSRVLLADFDLFGGTARLLFKLPAGPSVTDALRALEIPGNQSAEEWGPRVLTTEGLDILPAAATPAPQKTDPGRLRALLECARPAYDWLVVDLPSVFDRLSLLLLPDADHAFVISTADLPSLHLTRKAVAMLGLLGLSQDQFHVVVNRSNPDGLTLEAMAKILQAPVYASFPNDYLALHQALHAGRPLAECALARAIGSFAREMAALKPRSSTMRNGVTC
jgi:pilus assembly protein CpaE